MVVTVVPVFCIKYLCPARAVDGAVALGREARGCVRFVLFKTLDTPELSPDLRLSKVQ